MKTATKLAQPFPKKFVQQAPQGKNGEFINHAVVNQRLLQVVGPFDFHIVREIYNDKTLTGVVGALILTIDGVRYRIEEVGNIELTEKRDGSGLVDLDNGQRLKKASSDAFKRCAMRFGVGLDLWSKGQYFLYDKLKEAEEGDEDGEIPELDADLEAAEQVD